MSKIKNRKKTSTEKAPLPQETASPERPVKQGKKKQPPGLKQRKHPNWPVTVLAGIGMALTLYLTLTVWFGNTPLHCAEGSACDIVQQSRWGTFLGMPTAFWGFMTYAALTFIGFKIRNPEQHWKSAWIVALIGVGYSIYLTLVSHFVINALCPYCLVSLAIMVATFGVIMTQRPERMKNFKFKSWSVQTAIVALIIIGGMHLHYSGVFHPAAGPEDPYLKGLATHLAQGDAIFYGTFW
ncbi:vitamin K epoxide reductase family protein [Pelovirga terrestris]|uniref:Vitamin K epoxide reductase family protein n=1 Tax=Pelovirga terrestris TaxID=2771352 RepID=A0A8J6QVE5_9BACT|nr:vitamin K epoxide reductase family protein [Pelovirga terrestris]MBD1401600.1 vitamin K epoxide reductase family protein [Pelovirga terrestris]